VGLKLTRSQVSPNTHAPNKNSPRLWRERHAYSRCYINLANFDFRKKFTLFYFNIFSYLCHKLFFLQKYKSYFFFYVFYLLFRCLNLPITVGGYGLCRNYPQPFSTFSVRKNTHFLFWPMHLPRHGP